MQEILLSTANLRLPTCVETIENWHRDINNNHVRLQLQGDLQFFDGGRVFFLARQPLAADTVRLAVPKVGLARLAMAPSAIRGATGNQEFFLHLRKG